MTKDGASTSYGEDGRAEHDEEDHDMKRLKRQQTMRYNAPKDQLLWYQKIWMTLDDPGFSTASFWYAQFSLVIITVSTVTFCLETEINCQEFSQAGHGFVTADNCETWEGIWKYAEYIAVACFTAELLLRFSLLGLPLDALSAENRTLLRMEIERRIKSFSNASTAPVSAQLWSAQAAEDTALHARAS